MNYTKRMSILVLLFIIGINTANAQSEPLQNGDAGKFVTAYHLKESEIDGSNVSPANSESIPNGSKFSVVGSTNDSYIIYFWTWGTDDEAKDGEESANSKRRRLNFIGTKHRYFVIPKSAVAGNTKRMYQRAVPTIGAITYPLKYRPQTGKFEKSFSLAVTGGYSFLLKKTDPERSIALTAGIGAGSVTIDPSDTHPINGITKEEERASAIFSLNLIYIHKNLQIGISSGFDKLIGGNNINWFYDARGWFSFGIGANIFSVQKPATENEN